MQTRAMIRITDSTGHIRNIHFPFDVEVDAELGAENSSDHIAVLLAVAVLSGLPSEFENTDTILKTASNGSSTQTGAFKHITDPIHHFVKTRDYESKTYMDDGASIHHDSDFADNDHSVDFSYARGPHSSEERNNMISNNYSADIRQITNELENLLDPSKREINDLKKKHDSAISDLLSKLPPEIRAYGLKYLPIICIADVAATLLILKTQFQLIRVKISSGSGIEVMKEEQGKRCAGDWWLHLLS
ncbi:Serine/threonine-protein kinase wnk3 [Datura stramonium]|uniref:Serine/threonine-protein kinase wnk3 n=1 Tax=Datura stramonium TaxID=4076 RepID=A0ABS8V654_DATST|nr:Serine/threonine-protein kinase wnk3 [Datura stramonium]